MSDQESRSERSSSTPISTEQTPRVPDSEAGRSHSLPSKTQRANPGSQPNRPRSETYTSLVEDLRDDDERTARLGKWLHEIYHADQEAISSEAHLQLALTLAQIFSPEMGGHLRRDKILEALPQPAQTEVRKTGVTSLESTPSAITIEGENYYGIGDGVRQRPTWYALTPAVVEAFELLEYFGLSVDAATTTMEELPGYAPERAVVRALHENLDDLETASQHPQAPRDQDRKTRSPEPGRAGDQGRETRDPGTGPNLPPGGEAAKPGRRGVDPHCGLHPEPTATASQSGLSAAASNSAVARGSEVCCHPNLSHADLKRLRQAEPRCPYLPFPKQLTSALEEWRPVLAKVPGHRAMVQYLLFSDNFNDAKLDGLVLPWQQVPRFYGEAPATLERKRDYSTADLLRWYSREVDGGLKIAPPDYKKGLSRVVTNTGIPDEIWNVKKEAQLDPFAFDAWTYWINGKSADRDQNTLAMRTERESKIAQQEPAVDPPRALEEIQKYLNDLPSRIFSHGGYGLKSRIQNAIDEAKQMEFESEDAEDTALRQLYHMRHYPKPLYKVCDRFPRLKSDGYNELMNLTSDLRPSLYTDRDFELDLAKAHLSSYVPIAEEIGLDVPVLRGYLSESLNGQDLWRDLARCFDASAMPDEKARRSAAKTLYSLVYGSQINNSRYRIIKAYARMTGQWVDGDAVDDVFKHEFIDEILNVRGKIADHIRKHGGLSDAFGRFIPVDKWDGAKKDEDRWRGVLSYVNASYELALIWECVKLAIEEKEWAEEKSDRQPRFRIWLLQGDGFTLKIDRRRKPDPIISDLKSAVADKARELGMATALEVE